MSVLHYRLCWDGNLWHWEVLTEAGAKLRRGASDDMARSRAEAMLAGMHPATRAEIQAIELRRLHERFEISKKACTVAHRVRAILEQDRQHLQEACALSKIMTNRSRAAITDSRQILNKLARI